MNTNKKTKKIETKIIKKNNIPEYYDFDDMAADMNNYGSRKYRKHNNKSHKFSNMYGLRKISNKKMLHKSRYNSRKKS